MASLQRTRPARADETNAARLDAARRGTRKHRKLHPDYIDRIRDGLARFAAERSYRVDRDGTTMA